MAELKVLQMIKLVYQFKVYQVNNENTNRGVGSYSAGNQRRSMGHVKMQRWQMPIIFMLPIHLSNKKFSRIIVMTFNSKTKLEAYSSVKKTIKLTSGFPWAFLANFSDLGLT